MRALVLAAGRGRRMSPLSDECPKPLLEVGGKSLLVWQIERLRDAGIKELVINLGWRGERIVQRLGDGAALGVRIVYSPEPPTAWETGGAVASALPLLRDAHDTPFAVLSGDIFTAYDYARLHDAAARIAGDAGTSAHFVLTDNPPHHPRGDMALDADGRVRRHGTLLNYGNIAVFRAALFEAQPAHCAWRLFPWLYAEVDAGRVSGEHYTGAWHNVGTPHELAALDAALRRGAPAPDAA